MGMADRSRLAILFFLRLGRSHEVCLCVVALLGLLGVGSSALGASALVPDPRKDGWESEGLTDDAGKRLKLLGKMFEHPETADAPHLQAVFAKEFQATFPDIARASRCSPLLIRKAGA